MLIDTSGWFCIFDEMDSRHTAALDAYESSRIRITHSYVLAELVGLAISRRHSLSKVVPFLKDILNDSDIQTVWVDESITLQSIDLLAERLDKSWSLCDAVSFVIMESLNITEALTTDRHFEQAGFIKLLES